MRQQCLLQALFTWSCTSQWRKTCTYHILHHAVQTTFSGINLLPPFKQSDSCVTTRNYIILKTNISFALFSAGNSQMRCGCSVFCLVSTEISNSDKHQDSNSWRGIVIGLKRNGMQKLLSKSYSLCHCKEQHNTAHPVSSSQCNYVQKMFQDARDRCEYQLYRAFLPSAMGKESCIAQNTIYSSAHSAKYSESSERDLQYWLQLLGHIPSRCQTSSLLLLRQWQHASRHEIKCLMLSQYFD